MKLKNKWSLILLEIFVPEAYDNTIYRRRVTKNNSK